MQTVDETRSRIAGNGNGTRKGLPAEFTLMSIDAHLKAIRQWVTFGGIVLAIIVVFGILGFALTVFRVAGH